MCYIGKTNLETAMEQFGHKDQVQLFTRPFQLFPNASSNTGKDYYTWTAEVHGGTSSGYVKEANKQVIKVAKDVGLTYNLDKLIPANSFDALRVGVYAQEQGRAREWMNRAHKAYFTDELNIADHKTLAKLASEVGLNLKEVLNILASDKYKDTVKRERQIGSELGITGVPFYIFNDDYTVPGIRSSNAFLELLDKVWREEQPLQSIDNPSHGDSEGGNCADGVCKI